MDLIDIIYIKSKRMTQISIVSWLHVDELVMIIPYFKHTLGCTTRYTTRLSELVQP